MTSPKMLRVEVQSRGRGWVREVGALLALALALAACTQPRTQLVPVVASDLPDAQIQCVVAEAARVLPGQPFTPIDTPHLFYVRASGLPAVSLPFSFGLLPPGDDATARIELRVSALSACDDSDPAVRTVTRTVRTGFVRGQRLSLPVFLSTRCVGVICGDGLTCEDGTCVGVPEVDPSTLAPAGNPGDELRTDGGLPDGGAPDAGAPLLPGPGTLPTTLTPMWAVSAGPAFVFPGSFGIVGLAGEDVIVGARSDVGGTFAGTMIPASSIVVARLRPDGTTAWLHTFSTPATGLALQSYTVSSAVLVSPAGSPRLFLCGAVGTAGMTDMATGTTWAGTPGGLMPNDAWVASLDPSTGGLGRVVTVHSVASASLDTFCSLTTRTGGEVVATFLPYNGPAMVSGLSWGGGTITLPGGPFSSNFGVLVELDPRFDAAPPGVFETRVVPLPGADAIDVVPDGTGGLVIAGSGFTEPGPPLQSATPAASPTLVVARMASDGSITWRNRVVGSRAYAREGGLAVSHGRALVSFDTSPSMTTGPYSYQLGDTGTPRVLPWADGATEDWSVVVGFDLATGALGPHVEMPAAGWLRMAASDAVGEALVVGPVFAGDDFGAGPYTPNGDADMELLRLHADLTLASHREWTSAAMTRDELFTALVTPLGVVYVSGSTGTGGTATLATGVMVSGAFVTRL